MTALLYYLAFLSVDLSGFTGFALAAAIAVGSIGAAVILIKSNSAKQNLTLDQAAFARAQLLQDTQERELRAKDEIIQRLETEKVELRHHLEVLSTVVTSRDIILNGFEALDVSHAVLIAKRKESEN